MASRDVSGTRYPLLLGFYSQFQLSRCDNLSTRNMTTRVTAPVMLPVCREAQELKEGRWGNFDESLSFLPQQSVLIAGSSNGWLLCCTDRATENMNFIVCNPVTREFRILPEPHKPHRRAALAFTCRGHGTVQYEVFRVGVVRRTSPATTLEMETFSSATGEWTESSLLLPTPICLDTAFGPNLVFEDVVYWRACSYDSQEPTGHRASYNPVILAYDPAMQSVDVIQLPEHAQNYITWSDHIGQSEGKIHFARTDKTEIEVWVLEDVQRREWIMKHRVGVDKILQDNPHVRWDNSVGIVHFHPYMQSMLITLTSKPYWYDYRDGTLIAAAISGGIYITFPYEWPCEPSHDT